MSELSNHMGDCFKLLGSVAFLPPCSYRVLCFAWSPNKGSCHHGYLYMFMMYSMLEMTDMLERVLEQVKILPLSFSMHCFPILFEFYG